MKQTINLTEEQQTRKDLYFSNKKRIEYIIESIGFKLHETTEQDGNNGFYYPDHIWCTAYDNEGNLVNFSFQYNNKGKVSVSPCFKRNNRGEYYTPYSYDEKPFEIRFSLNKDVKAIKKDIENRFNPIAKGLFEKHNKAVENDNKYIDASLNNLIRLKGSELTKEEEKSRSIYSNINDISKIECHGDSVTIKLYSISIEKAEKIIKALS